MSKSSRVDGALPALGTGGGKHPTVLGVELSGPILSESSRTVFNEGGGRLPQKREGGFSGLNTKVDTDGQSPIHLICQSGFQFFFLRIVCHE